VIGQTITVFKELPNNRIAVMQIRDAIYTGSKIMPRSIHKFVPTIIIIIIIIIIITMTIFMVLSS